MRRLAHSLVLAACALSVLGTALPCCCWGKLLGSGGAAHVASCCRHNAMPAADAPSPATRDAQRRCACPKRAAVKEEAPKLECSFSGLDAAAVQPPAEYGLSVAGAFRAPAERTHRPPPCPIYLTHQALLV